MAVLPNEFQMDPFRILAFSHFTSFYFSKKGKKRQMSPGWRQVGKSAYSWTVYECRLIGRLFPHAEARAGSPAAVFKERSRATEETWWQKVTSRKSSRGTQSEQQAEEGDLQQEENQWMKYIQKMFCVHTVDLRFNLCALYSNKN